MRIIKQKNPINEEHKVNPLTLIFSSGLFTGFVPIAPGTAGSFLALLIYLIPGVSDTFILFLLTVLLFALGIYASDIMQKRYGYDPPQVVIDEIAGQLFTYLIASLVLQYLIRYKTFDPDFVLEAKLIFAGTGFFLFRFFDILKIQPGKYFEEKTSGFGVMMDDIVAGFYAGVITAAASHFIYFRMYL